MISCICNDRVYGCKNQYNVNKDWNREHTIAIAITRGTTQMSELTNYDDAVKTIKLAILRSQYSAVRSVNENQLSLYYWIGR